MFGDRSSDCWESPLEERLAALESDVQKLRREVSELGAAHEDAIDLALATAVPNGIFTLIAQARESGWRVTFRRRVQHDALGTIMLASPQGPVHDCSIELPLPSEEDKRRVVESDIRLRIGFRQAA